MSSTLSDETLRSALRAWTLAEPFSIRRLPGGFTSDVWYVETDKERFVAKYAYQPKAAFDGGLYAAEQVERHGIISGAPLRTKTGAISILVDGPHGQPQPLALLRFVPGQPLDPSETGAPLLYGRLLGRTHKLLINVLDDAIILDIYAFLLQEDEYVTLQPGLEPLIRQTIEAARDYEAHHPVTFGVIWADKVEIVQQKETDQAGIIDWGTIEHGPLLFDIALTTLWLFPEGSAAYDEFLQAYLAEAPISASELAGLDYYKALLLARQAKFFAYRVAANVTIGDSNPNSNARSLAEARRELELLLPRLHKPKQ